MVPDDGHDRSAETRVNCLSQSARVGKVIQTNVPQSKAGSLWRIRAKFRFLQILGRLNRDPNSTRAHVN